MDELFEDVDLILTGDVRAAYATSSSPDQSEASPIATAVLPAMLVPVAEPVTADPVEPLTPPAAPADLPWYRRRLPRVALGAAGLSLLAAAGVWWFKTQRPLTPVPTARPDEAAVDPSRSQSQTEEQAFLEYLNRSLNVIDGETSALETAKAPPVLPQVPANGTVVTIPRPESRTPNIIERVFVPVFQPPQITLPTAGIPARPAAPGQSAPPAPSGSNNSAATIPNVAPVNTYVLVGVLELGDRSAALFEINGVPQRVYVGEIIGSSGWSVVSVNSKEAVIRRNGEVRSVYIGQQF
jgi:hypothetical protein